MNDITAATRINTYSPLTAKERARVDKLTHVMEQSVRVPGTGWRVGLDGFLGLIPVVGDVIGAIFASWIIAVASRSGAPTSVLLAMVANVFIDTVLGAVPLLGDIFDFAWRANTKNLALLNEHLRHPAEARRKSRWRVTGIVCLFLLLIAGLIGTIAWVAGGALQIIGGVG